ncbi:MAG TPA: hypothetical protein VK742_17945 [Candidatus Sulfotelmatobacter sp.]|nr:hypothetical protein [Candidatus Sulfotelmatobacter sp.]
MRTPITFKRHAHRLAALMIVILSAVSVQADPIALPEKPITPEISFVIGFAILLEVICIWWILRRSRKPRFLILWLIGMHLLTYPPFLGLLWMLHDMRPVYAVAVGEGLVVIIEGVLIYLICRFIPSAKTEGATPSIIKCLLASLLGNIVSAAAFPALLAVYERFVSA